MKIISKKKQAEILKRLTAVQIMAKRLDAETFTAAAENLADIAYEIGGTEGASKVARTAFKYEEDFKND